MSGEVSIRPARLADAAGIADVHIETWRSAYAGVIQDSYLIELDVGVQARAWRRDIIGRRPGTGILVATVRGERGDQVVGFGSWGRCRSVALPYAGEVYTLYISSDWQGRGLGRRLLSALFRQLMQADQNSAFLWVLSANPSRFFYDAMGGRPVAERKERFAGALLDETAYAWPDLSRWLATQPQSS
jgi:ribosomal protein S18 acetylase RimI-like enzyme